MHFIVFTMTICWLNVMIFCTAAWSKLAYHVNCEYDFSKWHLLFYAWYFEFHANLKKRNWLALFCMRPIGVSMHTFSLLLYWYQNLSTYILYIFIWLTEVAGEGGPDLAPQKFLLSQKFRHLMRCKKYLEKIFLSCLVSEIQLFVYIFG